MFFNKLLKYLVPSRLYNRLIICHKVYYITFYSQEIQRAKSYKREESIASGIVPELRNTGPKTAPAKVGSSNFFLSAICVPIVYNLNINQIYYFHIVSFRSTIYHQIYYFQQYPIIRDLLLIQPRNFPVQSSMFQKLLVCFKVTNDFNCIDFFRFAPANKSFSQPVLSNKLCQPYLD